jgi:archaellum component FlaF (FlaF/FlaG flagellin family)
VIIAFKSETIYIEVHSPASSAVALFISALIYAGITGYQYYNIYVNVDRK